MPRKPDADEILEHMRQLPSSLGLDRNRRLWSNWLYRSDHVENAAAILNNGRLLSRAAAERGGLIRVDSASPQYVGHLSAGYRDLVRPYFRPRRPTQYRNRTRGTWMSWPTKWSGRIASGTGQPSLGLATNRL